MPIQPPNYTQIPNEVLDSFFLLPGGECKVISWMFRYASTHPGQNASVSLIAKNTGLSKQETLAAIDNLIKRGWLIASEDGPEYCLNLEESAGEA